MPLESGVSSRDDVARTPPASLIADRGANNPWKSSGLPCRKSIGGNLDCAHPWLNAFIHRTLRECPPSFHASKCHSKYNVSVLCVPA